MSHSVEQYECVFLAVIPPKFSTLNAANGINFATKHTLYFIMENQILFV